MDLGKWLRDRKKQVEGVVAQVNPFDGGKTYSSVTRRPTVDPFKSNNVNAKYGVLADKGRRDQFIQNNQRESFSTPIATFQSLRDIPGKIGNTLINNPIADKAADITGTNRQTSVEGRNSSDYLKPTGVIDNTVAAVSNLGQFNPIRSAGDIGQYLDTVSEKSRFKPVGDVIGNQTKDAANFGKPIEGSEWDARNLKNPVAKNAGEFSTMLGQTANFAVPVAGPLAVSGMIANEANETVNTARARGEDETIANLKGLLSGAGQAAVERYSSKLTTALPGSTKLAGLAKNKLIGIPASLAGGAITEGGEEFVQGLMGNAARGNDLTEGLKEQTIQGAKGGLLLGGFFGGANYAANRSQGTTQEAVQRVEQQNPTLQQTGIPAQPGSIRERIQQAKENVKSTIAETNQLLRQDDAGGYMGGTNAQDRINDPLESLKQEAESVRKVKQKWEQKFRQQAEKLSPEETNKLRTKMMKDAQKELSGYRTEDLIDADIKNARQNEIPDSTTSNKVKELLEKPVSKNDYDPNDVGYFLDLSSENIKDVTPLRGIEQYGDSMYVDTKAGLSEVKIQDWSDSGQGFRVSNGNGNEIARFNTNEEAVEFAKKALTIENEAKRQGKRVILSGSRVENRTQSQPPKSTPPARVQQVADPLESLKQEAKPFIIPKTNPTDVTKLSDKDLQYYGKQGYTSITDKYGNTREIAPVKSDGVQRLDSLNPTGGVFVDYNPKTRATMPLADNMTTYDKTAGKAPDELVTIYRGAPKNQKGIVAGDFITTNRELAKSYTGDGNVLEMQVPASHILDDKTSPLGEEYLYRPTQSQPPKSTRTIEKSPFQSDLEKAGFGARDEFKKIPVKKPKPTDNPLESLKQEASKYKSAEEFVNSQANLLHGTKADFTEFDPSLLGTNTGAPSAKKGFFFTDTPEIANHYANPGRNYGTAISKNLDDAFNRITSRAKAEGLDNSLSNNSGAAMIVGSWPKVSPGASKETVIKAVIDKIDNLKTRFDSPEDIAKIERYKKITLEELANTPITELEMFGRVMKSKVDFKNPLEIDDNGFRNGASYAQRIDEAIAKGHDGVIIKNTQDPLRGNIYVALNKNQILTEKQLTDLYNQATKPKGPIKNTFDGPLPKKDPLESLKAEARKYGSAEEFVDSKINSYHQTDAKFDKFENTNQPFRFSGANFFLDTKPPKTIKKYLVEANTNLKNPLVIEDGNITQPMVDKAIKDGYDGIINKLPEGNGFPKRNEIAVFNPETIQTRQQLTDLYNQATKKQGGLRTLMRDEGGGYDGGKSAQDRVNKSKSPLTDKAYSETFGVSLEEAKKDITSINTSKTNPLDSVGMTEQEATRKLESNAPTMSPGNKKTKSLVDSMINDKKLTEAARIAQKEGRELNYFAKKDNNGRSVGIEEYNPSRQRIEAGFVVDNKTGKVLGNHIKVDATGTQINVGGEVVNISDVVGNPLDWKGDYEVSSTMERNIFKNAPNKEIAQKTYKFVVANKIQAEATLRKEIESQRKTLNQNVKDVQKVKPWSVSDKDFKADIFDFIENKKSQADIASKYGPKATQAIVKYKNETRKLYDNLLDRANTELAKFGEKTIPKRSDYITHINELNQQPSFAGELMGQLQNSMLGEGYTTTRGGVPGDIAGRTENFSPRKRWNPFAQQRKGGEYTKDPFKAVDSYLEPTLYNIHMTESAVRARAVESAFRTAEILKNTEATKVSTDLDRELEKYKKQSNNAKLVSGFQEYANALAGKTQRWDRQVIDASKGTATALKGWQGLQRIGGRATILGNINSVLMQPLNQASVIAEVKLPNYIKGVASSLAGNNVEDKSPFIRARAAKIESAFRSKGQKVMDKAGIPLQFVELASVKLAWNAEYQQVLSEGLKGQDAIIEADRRTEKAVAGRGIADKPELYRSTLTNGLLQYTLEVNAQNKKFWRDLTPAQKGKFVVAAFGMNTVMEAVTGNEPLPDFLGAAIDTFRDFLDDDDDTPLENAGKGVQRFASEAVSMNPMLSAGANLLPDSTKKTLFGSDSDLTRFEGVPAPIGVIQNAVDVGKNVANGDVKKARDSALKLIPGGNQIRKTLQGKELIQDGGKYDKNGKLQYPAPESPLGKAQALLFGPSAIKNAREYYDSITDKISGISTKKDASGKEIDDFKTIATAAFGTEKGKEFMALTNDDERKEFARQSSENRGIYEQYKSMQKAFNGGDDLLPEGLSKESEAILNKYDRMEAKTKEDIFYRENDAEYKYELAKYEKDKLEGTISEVDAIRKEKSLAKQAIGSKYEKGIRDVYSLSKEQIEDLVTGDPAGKAIYDKLVKYDKELYDAGLISYLKFKNGLASGRGGRGRDKKDTSLTDKYALQGQTLSRLQKLLAGTIFAGAETVTTPKTQKAKQKKITVNMKA